MQPHSSFHKINFDFKSTSFLNINHHALQVLLKTVLSVATSSYYFASLNNIIELWMFLGNIHMSLGTVKVN